MKSIITFVLLLPFVLTINPQEDGFEFIDAPSQLSSVLSNGYPSQQRTNDDVPIEYSKRSHLKNLMPKKFHKNGHSIYNNFDKKNRYLNLKKNHGNKYHQKEKRSVNHQRQMHKNVEDHLKKHLQYIKSSDESRHLRVKKNYLSDSFRDRRETGSGFGYDDGEEIDPDDDDAQNYDDDEEETDITDPGITVQPIDPIDIEPKNNPSSSDKSYINNNASKEQKVIETTIEDIDEEEMFSPVLSPEVEKAMDNITSSLSTTPASKLTTIPQTTPSTTTSTSTSTTTTTTTTTTPPPTSTMTSTTQFVSSTSPIIETTMNQSNTNDIVSSSSSSSSSTTTAPSTTTSEETTKADVVILETTTMSNKIDDNDIDSNSESTILNSNENDTLSTTQLTTTTLVNTVSTSMEKQDINVTMDEITESTESLPAQSTTILPPMIAVSSTSTTTTPEPTTVTTTTSTTSTSTTTTTTTPEPTTTTTTTTTTTVNYGVTNYPPRQNKRLQKVSVTAGKLLSHVIPADTFSDLEDGDTRNLRLSLLDHQGIPINSSTWFQLNSKTQEVYGLPLAEDISKYENSFVVVASDSQGLNVSDILAIQVQQHRLSRAINYQLSIYLKIDKPSEFPKDVDWKIKVVEKLSRLYDDVDTSQITVLKIDTINSDQFIFTWTNDSTPRSSDCPKYDISKLWSVLVSKENSNEPSKELKDIFSPEMSVKRVISQGYGQCDEYNLPDISKPEFTGENESPMPRNQVDHVNATVGQLLVFKVPADTFYDREDGSAKNMKMSLLTGDRMTIPASDWLQFDSKNQEFYGIPMKKDLRNARKEYLLVVTDKGGLTANDGLIVQIHNSKEKNYSVEFSMNLDVPYDIFSNSALQKRTFIEKLAELFNDKDTSMIELKSINELLTNTVVTWRNNTLSTDPCPNDEIIRLMSVLSKSDKTVSPSVFRIMGSEFPVSQINRTPLGKCLGQMTNIYNPDNSITHEDNNNINNNDAKTIDKSTYDDYIMTFILPAIIISTMLLFAGIIALVLYKRKRSGKMSVCEHDDERQSFRSKGIPVIFQDELEEKPDPGNKSPVILKEEKPPLPPPEYQKSDDGADEPMLPKGHSEEPYQPPPPFARNSDNNRQNRPKPTPTYRKPPPYVPP